MKKLSFLLLIVMLPLAVCAQKPLKVKVDGMKFELNTLTKEAELERNMSNPYRGHFIVPGKITYEGQEYVVTSIGKGAFYMSDVAYVEIPNTVKNIGPGAFFGCKLLSSITIPESVETIGDNAFRYSKNLTLAYVPKHLEGRARELMKYARIITDKPANQTPMMVQATPQTTAPQVTVAPRIVSDVDKDIPLITGSEDENTFAVIIGNENYTMVRKVDYAKNDARIFAEYCQKTLGLPEKNVRIYEDATYAMMLSAVRDIQDIAKAYNGDINVVFYYAGHGIPDEKDKDAYLLPIDVDGRQTHFCYPVSKLYNELGAMNAKSVVVLMDACFSGAVRGDGMLMAARGVAIKAKPMEPHGKMVVMTAASGDETAFPYAEKEHGMFTYFLLKKLRDTKGNCTLGELSSYIKTKVQQQSVVVNRKPQTPTISVATSLEGNWKEMKLK